MTQEQKYTQGPWNVHVLTSSDPNGDEWETDVEITSECGKFIHGHDLGYRDDVDGEIRANARLIAAAPDLYEALKEADKELETLACAMGLTSELVAVCEQIKAALAKAEAKS